MKVYDRCTVVLYKCMILNNIEMKTDNNNNRKPASRRFSGIIGPEEIARKRGTIPNGRAHWVRQELLTLPVGATLFVHYADWNWRGKNTPSRIVTSLNEKGYHFVIAKAGDGSGWMIKREK